MAKDSVCVVGLDIGRSATKIVTKLGCRRYEGIFPSATCEALKLSDETEAERAERETVALGSKSFFFGETAIVQGHDELAGGLRDDWVQTDHHSTLFLAGLRKLQIETGATLQDGLVVVGLPAAFFTSQKDDLLNRLKKLAPRMEMKVLPQPMGPFYQAMLDEKGLESDSQSFGEKSLGVIEVGQYTTDTALIMKGRVIEDAFGSCDGMRVAAEQLVRLIQEHHKVTVGLAEASGLLEHGLMKNFGQTIDIKPLVVEAVKPLATQIVDRANQAIGRSARFLDEILVAGGGAPLVIEELKQAWPHVKLTKNSRFSVADGFCRYGLGLLSFRKNQKEPTPIARTGTEG